MNKVISIEFFRFIFMLQICMHHFGHFLGFVPNGYIAVDFYFILSGFLMYKSYTKPTSKPILDYTIAKIRHFLPSVIVVVFMEIIIRYAISNPLDNLDGVINTLLFTSDLGMFQGETRIIHGFWYLSVLVVGGGIIYAILKKCGDLSVSVLFPVIILLVYTYILHTNHYNLEMFTTIGAFSLPVWRGIAGMCLGCVLCKFYLIKGNSLGSKYLVHLNILTLCSVVLYIYCMLREDNNDGYVLISSSVIILSCFTNTSLINQIIKQKVWLKLGELSLDMLLIHLIVRRVIIQLERVDLCYLDFDNNKVYSIFFHLTLLVISSSIFHYILTKYIKRFFDKLI